MTFVPLHHVRKGTRLSPSLLFVVVVRGRAWERGYVLSVGRGRRESILYAGPNPRLDYWGGNIQIPVCKRMSHLNFPPKPRSNSIFKPQPSRLKPVARACGRNNYSGQSSARWRRGRWIVEEGKGKELGHTDSSDVEQQATATAASTSTEWGNLVHVVRR